MIRTDRQIGMILRLVCLLSLRQSWTSSSCLWDVTAKVSSRFSVVPPFISFFISSSFNWFASKLWKKNPTHFGSHYLAYILHKEIGLQTRENCLNFRRERRECNHISNKSTSSFWNSSSELCSSAKIIRTKELDITEVAKTLNCSEWAKSY